MRLTPPRNSQRAAIHFASAHDLGAIAQLGERVAGSDEGVGSSPTGSTSADASITEVGAHEFRNHFGYYMERAAAGDEILIRRHGKPYARLGPPTARQEALDVAA